MSDPVRQTCLTLHPPLGKPWNKSLHTTYILNIPVYCVSCHKMPKLNISAVKKKLTLFSGGQFPISIHIKSITHLTLSRSLSRSQNKAGLCLLSVSSQGQRRHPSLLHSSCQQTESCWAGGQGGGQEEDSCQGPQGHREGGKQLGQAEADEGVNSLSLKVTHGQN